MYIYLHCQLFQQMLSRLEMRLFSYLRRDNSRNWKPFEHINVSNVLKEVTFEMTGVGVTASGLRSAAESHAELLGDANVRSALNYAEGHSSKSNNTRHGIRRGQVTHPHYAVLFLTRTLLRCYSEDFLSKKWAGSNDEFMGEVRKGFDPPGLR